MSGVQDKSLLCVVFPKQFERAKFISELCMPPPPKAGARGDDLDSVSKWALQAYIRVDDFLHEVVVNTSVGSRVFLIALVADSDVMFGFKFNRIVNIVRDKYDGRDVRYMIVGTAGILGERACSKPLAHPNPDRLLSDAVKQEVAAIEKKEQEDPEQIEKDVVGDVYFTDRAVKFDRGGIKGGGSVNLNKKKFAFAECDNKGVAHLVESKLIDGVKLLPFVASSNMLIECDELPGLNPVEYNHKGEAVNATLVGMETFDFFKSCEMAKVSCVGALRVVSDVCGDDFSAITRCFMRFDKVVSAFLKILERISPIAAPCQVAAGAQTELLRQLRFDVVQSQFVKIQKVVNSNQQPPWARESLQALRRRQLEFYVNPEAAGAEWAVYVPRPNTARQVRIVQQMFSFVSANTTKHMETQHDYVQIQLRRQDDHGISEDEYQHLRERTGPTFVLQPRVENANEVEDAKENEDDEDHEENDDDDDDDDDEDPDSKTRGGSKKRCGRKRKGNSKAKTSAKRSRR
eukprot:TRINITY_DN66223_c8_g7_i1.p1 TRINITY_DN66223_c8_g7~~TRINITY_DN66223_c8_g7_i1.p1  ORF type:complete len:517 (-),score=166.30 TRINITY_DN66223_c8_g7_i1:69-1619(-)